MTLNEAFRLAVANVAAFGDTDIFPTPLDRFPCQDNPEPVVALLGKIHNSFDQYLASLPPENIDTLAPLGYTAFRWATQVDPIWNLYFLSLVLSIGETIEAKRLAVSEESVFSYRFAPDHTSAHLFADSTWRHYKRNALEKARKYPFVLVADVSDFYSRVAHHRLENELIRLQLSNDATRRIKILFSKFSQTRSYGLPVGGPASRILAELALNPVDLYLNRKGIPFCRYVDDFHLFAESKEQAFRHLSFLAKILFNEGLSLQKAKTRILSSYELLESSIHLDQAGVEDKSALPPEARLMRLSVRYDPYSPTAEQDYAALSGAVGSIDIIGILTREMAKSSIDIQVTKQAIAAIRALAPNLRDGAIAALFDTKNLETLAPVFANVMKLARSLYSECSEATKDIADLAMLELFNGGSHLIHNELNLAYMLQVFGQRQSAVKERILISLYEKTSSILARKEIILIMAKWGVTFWLSDLLGRFGSLSNWERKAFIVASFHMADEGEHWQKHTKLTLSDAEVIIRDWYKARLTRNPEVPV